MHEYRVPNNKDNGTPREEPLGNGTVRAEGSNAGTKASMVFRANSRKFLGDSTKNVIRGIEGRA